MNAPRTVVLLSVLVLAATAAEARPPSKRAEAQKHYDAGIAHYKAQEYGEAADEFETAYELKPEPSWLYNLGQSCRLAHRNEKALGYYRQYLAAIPDAENRPAVEQRLADVEKTIAAEKAAAPAVASTPASTPARAPAAAVDTRPLPAPVDAELPRTPYQLGARVRGIFVTNLMLQPYLQAATSMESWSVGLEFIYRRPMYDVVTSLDYSSIDVHDGNWLANGHNAATDTHFLEFRGLGFLSVDVSIIGHTALTRWLELRYGAGLGVGGAVTGNLLDTRSFGGCTSQNASNLAACHPLGVDLTAKNREAQLKATENGSTGDDAGAPHRHVSRDVPPAMGVVNVLVGLRIKLPKKFAAQMELGFRDAIFFGVGAHYLF